MRSTLHSFVLISLAFFPASRDAAAQTAPAPAQSGPSKTGERKSAKKRDHSGENLVIEQLTSNLTFSADGTGEQEQTVRVRVQSEGAVKQFGVLSFSYREDLERFDAIEVQVRKPDGRIVVTPEANVQDLPAAVTREAPTYSSLREKQVPVKALGIGDVLEWRVRRVRTKAEVPNQFWIAHDFTKGQIVLEEVLRVTVPAGKYVKVSSPNLKPEIHEEGGHRIYVWKTSCEQASREDETAKPHELRPGPDVQLTTFKSWEEVGQWFGALERAKAQVTPPVQAKAAELTAGLKTNAERQRALYQFVATKFRYISISFGDGRYQPHSAEEVLANQYGDCKDKHTLFAALLRAAGIEAWPALIGAGISFDPDVPSPGQFNHVITYIPQGTSSQWLDTTPEVAPYGLLQRPLRDRQTLVIPDASAPSLMTTAKELPFPAEENIKIESKLGADGTLTGHFDIHERGDGEVILRSVFHAAAPALWPTLAQRMAAAMGFAGTVSDLDVDNPANLEQPFHYSYTYERKNYSDWENRRLAPPLPGFGLSRVADADKPPESTYMGAAGEYKYQATVALPEGYSAEIPANTQLQTAFAEYHASYSLDGGVLSAERVFTIRASKLSPEQWDEYRKFAKAVVADESQSVQLVRAGAGSGARVVREVPEAAELIQRATQAMERRDLNTARDALAQAERLNPQQINLWTTRSSLYALLNENEKAIEALKKEAQYHPGNETAYRTLAGAQRRYGHRDDAIDTLRRLLKIAPQNSDGASELASVLFECKKYGEAVEPLKVALQADPDDTSLQISLVEALVRGGQKTEGLAALAKLREQTLDPDTLNNAAWILTDAGADHAMAKELAERAIWALESDLKEVKLAAMTDDQLKAVEALGATWDTLGWAAFGSGDLRTAEQYIRAAWLLIQHPAVADHLGQIYERQGKKAEAIHAYQLALAVTPDSPETRKRLEKLDGAVDHRPELPWDKQAGGASISPEDELSQLRTAPIPQLAYQHGSADFFLLFSKNGVEDVQFVRGDESLKPAASALRKAQYNMPFPDQGPEKIARRGILSCSEDTKPNCSIVFLLPINTTN